jgi:hypothetical protein
LVFSAYKECVVKLNYSHRDQVIPDSTQMLGYKTPKYFEIGIILRP